MLPKYQGLHTHQRAIEAGDDEHGASVHFVTEELDGGPVILQARVPIFEGDSADEVAARSRCRSTASTLVVQWFCEGRFADARRVCLPRWQAAWPGRLCQRVTASSSKTNKEAQASLVISIGQRNGCHHVR